ncbi:MAG: hypothetical protein U9Q15_03605, partial [Patescibacteria group bacterium]|nr:hypothetical protein [Patescibacteria group bacterium]
MDFNNIESQASAPSAAPSQSTEHVGTVDQKEVISHVEKLTESVADPSGQSSSTQDDNSTTTQTQAQQLVLSPEQQAQQKKTEELIKYAKMTEHILASMGKSIEPDKLEEQRNSVVQR